VERLLVSVASSFMHSLLSYETCQLNDERSLRSMQQG
jgi:hypothetical protein